MLEYASKDQIPEGLRDQFVEIDGKWVPDGYVPKTTFAEIKTKADERQAALKAWEGLDAAQVRERLKAIDGLDPAEAKAALEERKTLRAELDKLKTGKTDEEFTAAIDARWGEERKALQAEIEKLKAKAESVTGLNRKLSIGAEFRAAAARAKGFRSDSPALLEDGERLASQFFDFDEEGKVKPIGGKKNAKGEDFSMDDFFELQRTDRPFWFMPSGNGGGAGGAGGEGGGTKATMTRAEFDAITDPTAKMKAGLENTITD